MHGRWVFSTGSTASLKLRGGLLPLRLAFAATLGRVAPILVRAPVLLHVVFASEGLVALWAEGILFAGVFLGVASGMA